MTTELQRGDKLYSCFNGELEEVTFIREKINPGASLPTFLLRGKNGEFSCSTDMYTHRTPVDAYVQYVKDCRAAVPLFEKQVDEANAALNELHSEIGRVNEIIYNLGRAAVAARGR